MEPLEAADQPKDDVELDDARVRTLFRAVVRENERPFLERGVHPLRRDDDPGQRRRRKKGYEQVVHMGIQLDDGKRTSGPIVRLHARTWKKICSQLSKRVHRHPDHRRLRGIQSGGLRPKSAMLGACAKVFRGRVGRTKRSSGRIDRVPDAGTNGEDLPYRSEASKTDEKRMGKRKDAARKRTCSYRINTYTTYWKN